MPEKLVNYASRKTYAAGFLDLALLVANVSQLKVLSEGAEELKATHIGVATLIVLSIGLQVAVGCIFIYLGYRENDVFSAKSRRTNRQREGKSNNNSIEMKDIEENRDVFVVVSAADQDDGGLKNSVTDEAYDEVDGPAVIRQCINGHVEKHSTINTIATCGVFLILVLNVIISGMDLGLADSYTEETTLDWEGALRRILGNSTTLR